MIDIHMIDAKDVRAALAQSRGVPMILPVGLPVPAKKESFVSYSNEGEWRVMLRLCSKWSGVMHKYERTGGAILAVHYAGVNVDARIKAGWTRHDLTRRLTHLCVAARRLHRLALYRTNLCEIVDSHIAARPGEATGKGSPSRQRLSNVTRLARKLTGLSGWQGTLYSNMSVEVCRAINAAIEGE